MDIDTVIAEATKVAEPAPASTEAKTVDLPKQEAVEAHEADAENKETQTKADSELTAEQLAKREANRQSHLNSKLAKMRRENRELRDAVERNQAPQAPKAQLPNKADNGAPVKPVEGNFATWGEFLDAKDVYYEALADWKVEQKLSERDTNAAESVKQQTIDTQKVERINTIAKQEEDFAKNNPEYTALYNQHSDFMNNLPIHVAEALMEADNATLALFALMKEGGLDSLEDMSPYKISMEIGKAELRGERYLNQNKATSAPAPMTPAKGNSAMSKTVTSMNTEELLKWAVKS